MDLRKLAVSVNSFFLFVFSGLVMIFVFFKPLDIKEQEFFDVPLFEIKTFSMYELTAVGLKTFMAGNNTLKYEDRYLVENIDYTDNSKDYIANMKADKGLYRDDIVDLTGNVSYIREDGLSFESQFVTYDKNTSIVESKGDFVAYRDENSIFGSSMKYNNLLKKMESTNVLVKYQLQESKL